MKKQTKTIVSTVLAVTVVGGLAYGGLKLYQNWDTVKNKANEYIQEITSKKQIEDLNNQVKDLKLKLDEKTNEVTVLNTNIEKLQSELATAKQDLAELEASADVTTEELATARANVEQLETQIIDKENELAQVQSELATTQEELTTAQARIILLETENEELRKQLESYQTVTTSASKFTFNGNKITGYIGEETDITLPSSYSLGEILPVTKEFIEFSVLHEYFNANGFNGTLYADGTDATYIITSEEDLMNNMSNIDMLIYEFGCVKMDVEEQTYIDGNDYQVDTIGARAFEGCSALTTIDIPSHITNIEEYAFLNCSSLNNVVLPSSINTLSNCMFMNCSALTNIELPQSITSIGVQAFGFCTALKNLEIPQSVTEIKNYAFSGCSAMESLSIPNSVTMLGGAMFYRCTALESIVIPTSVTEIGENLFLDCSNLKTIYYTGTEEEWNAISIHSNNSVLASATVVYNYVQE